MRRCPSCSASTNMASRFHGGVNPGYPGQPRLHPHADEVRREALRPDQGRLEGRDRGLRRSGLAKLARSVSAWTRQRSAVSKSRVDCPRAAACRRAGGRSPPPARGRGRRPRRNGWNRAGRSGAALRSRSASGMPGPRSATSIRDSASARLDADSDFAARRAVADAHSR